jgi:multidrug efflux system outer membrane protein
LYNVNLGISSWELDLFGRIRSLKDAALQEYLATEQACLGMQISLVSEVANTYLTLAADRELLKLAQDTLNSQEASYNLIRRRHEVGASSELDLRQAQTRVDAARVDIARYTSIVAIDENALRLLVGSTVPESLLPLGLGTVATLQDISPGLPSDVLLMPTSAQHGRHSSPASRSPQASAPRVTSCPGSSSPAQIPGASFLRLSCRSSIRVRGRPMMSQK